MVYFKLKNKGNKMITDIGEIKALLEMAKLYRPVADEVIDMVIEEYGPVLGKVVVALRDAQIEQTDRTIKAFTERGYTREESILLTINANQAMQEALKNAGNGKKK